LFVIYLTNLSVGLIGGNKAIEVNDKKYIYVYRDSWMKTGKRDFVPLEDTIPAFG
jgi:hypothetical protein